MSLTRLWCLVLSVHASAMGVNNFVHSYAGVNKGVNVSVNTNCTTQPDPPHNSHMSPTHPHMHGKCTSGLHSHGLHHLSSHPYSHSWLGLHSYTHVSGCRVAQRTTLKVSDPPLESAERARCGYPNSEVQRGRRYAAGSAFLIILNRGSSNQSSLLTPSQLMPRWSIEINFNLTSS